MTRWYRPKLEDPPAEKECPKCKITKPFSEFYKNRATRDGLTSRCKDCTKADRKKYYESSGKLKPERNEGCFLKRSKIDPKLTRRVELAIIETRAERWKKRIAYIQMKRYLSQPWYMRGD